MKTIKTKEIDGYQIITGIGQLAICGVGTREIAKDKIAALPETATLAGMANKQSACRQKIKQAEGSIKNVTLLREGAEVGAAKAEQDHDDQMRLFHERKIKKYDKDIAEYEMARVDEIENIQRIESEMRKIIPVIDKKTKRIKRKNPVFCMPSQPGEYIDAGLNVTHQIGEEGHEHDELRAVEVPDGQTVDSLIALYLARGENEQIDINGVTIPDFRGCQYFFDDGNQWVESEIITALNVTKETVVVDEYQDQACAWDELEPQYQEEIRLQRMSQEEKVIEFESKKESLLAAASKMRSELEITGTTPASSLTQSREFYNAELEILQTKYGIR